jgi:hypothetical protein
MVAQVVGPGFEDPQGQLRAKLIGLAWPWLSCLSSAWPTALIQAKNITNITW